VPVNNRTQAIPSTRGDLLFTDVLKTDEVPDL